MWHIWHTLGGTLAAAAATAAQGLTGAGATAVRPAPRRTVVGLVRAVLDAAADAVAVAADQSVAAHPLGADLARARRTAVEAVLTDRGPTNHGLGRGGPAWCGRDFR